MYFQLCTLLCILYRNTMLAGQDRLISLFYARKNGNDKLKILTDNDISLCEKWIFESELH